MTQAKITKPGRKNDGGSQIEITPEEMAQLAKEKPLTGLIPAMIKQDRGASERGLDDEHEQGEVQGEGDEEESGDSEPESDDANAKDTKVEVADDAEGLVTSERHQSTGVSREKKTVWKINEITNNTLVRAKKLADEGKLEIGDCLVDDAYDSKIEDLLSNKPPKSQSLTKIAQDPELLADRRALGRWARAAALRRLLMGMGLDVSPFSLSHYEALLLEQDGEKRLELALEILEHRYSARKTKELIQDSKRESFPEDIGKTLRGNIAQIIGMVQKPEILKTGSNKDLLLKDLSKRDRKILLDQIRKGKPQFSKLLNFLNDLEDNLTNIDKENPTLTEEGE